jgi:hypothetical protein
MQLYRSEMLKFVAANDLIIVVEHGDLYERHKDFISLKTTDGKSLDPRLGLFHHLGINVDRQFLDHCIRYGFVRLEEGEDERSIYALTEEGSRQARH